MSVEDLEKKLFKLNFNFRWKVIQDLENIDLAADFPKFPILFLTCMDPRVNINTIFQLNPGDVIVLKNAGNILTIDMLRSILVAIHEYNINYIIILGHLDCLMTKINLIELKEKLYTESGQLLYRKGNHLYTDVRNFFKPFPDILNNIREQVQTLRDFLGFPSNVKIGGWLYDVHTGWVFETEKLTKYQSTKEFMKNYKDSIAMKDLELVNFLESLEIEIPTSKSINSEENRSIGSKKLSNERKYSHGDKSEFINNDPHPDKNYVKKIILSKSLRITIPKIHVPEIKVSIPSVYKRKKERE